MLFSTSGAGAGAGGTGGLGGPAGVGGAGNVAGAGNPAGVGNVAGAAGGRVSINSLLNPDIDCPQPANRPIPWGSGDADTFVAINDAEGIGRRGYQHNGNNQPYASRIAGALEHHKNNNARAPFHLPFMDNDAQRFFRDWARHHRPELYDNPRPDVNVYPNTRNTIRMLRNCR